MSTMPRNLFGAAEDWLKARVGKRVFRSPNGCSCSVCAEVVENGIVVLDKTHACYMAETAIECGVYYADTKQELE